MLLRRRLRFVALLAVCSIGLGGCTKRLGLGVASGGLGLLVVSEVTRGGSTAQQAVSNASAITGLAALLAGLAIAIGSGDDIPDTQAAAEEISRERANKERTAVLDAKHHDDEEAVALTKAAAAAARKGDCTTVVNIEPRVATLDDGAHARFGRDVAIARCLHGAAPPAALDQTIVREGLGDVMATVMACGPSTAATGVVRVSVKVSADGHVEQVTIKETPDPALGACVAAAIQQAAFAKTMNGGTFATHFEL